LRLQTAHRRTETTVRSAPNGMKVRFGRAVMMFVVSLSGFGGQADAGSGQEPGECGGEIELPVGRTSGSSAQASVSPCGGWAICHKGAAKE
jgi:hypothetical protein